MILNVVNQPARPGRDDAGVDGGQPRGRARAPAPLRAGPGAGDPSSSTPGVLEWLAEPDADGRTLRLAVELQENFALNQPLASFALVAFELIDPESEHHALDVLSVVEAILDDPFPVLKAQANKERGEAVAEMKAQGIEYEERMELLEQVTYPHAAGRAAERRAARLPRDAPVGARVRPLAQVGRARHV